MQGESEKNLYTQKASIQLNICIIGCGIGGLAAAHCLGQAGHKITMVESKLSIGEIGAGVHTAPNVTRLLYRWGVGEALERVSVTTRGIEFRRWDEGSTVGRIPYGDCVKKYGAPYYQVHRADLHRILHDLASPSIQALHVGHKVTAISSSSVTLENGTVLEDFDVILGADGIHSVTRATLVGSKDLQRTGEAAYRVTIPGEVMLSDPELKDLIEEQYCTAWLGPEMHVIGYSMRCGKEYNMALLHPDNDSSTTWLTAGNLQEMKDKYAGWDPRLDKLFSAIGSCMHTSFTTYRFEPESSWVHKDWNVTLLGDACHPMVPYRAQGAAMAIEDAAALGNLLSRITDKSQIRAFLLAYEELRRPRAMMTQDTSLASSKMMHLPDGPAQEARDKIFANPDPESEQAKMHARLDYEQYTYDPDQEVEKWWVAGGREKVLA